MSIKIKKQGVFMPTDDFYGEKTWAKDDQSMLEAVRSCFPSEWNEEDNTRLLSLLKEAITIEGLSKDFLRSLPLGLGHIWIPFNTTFFALPYENITDFLEILTERTDEESKNLVESIRAFMEKEK